MFHYTNDTIVCANLFIYFFLAADMFNLPKQDEARRRARHLHRRVLAFLPLPLHHVERKARQPDLPGVPGQMEGGSGARPGPRTSPGKALDQRGGLASKRRPDDGGSQAPSSAAPGPEPSPCRPSLPGS